MNSVEGLREKVEEEIDALKNGTCSRILGDCKPFKKRVQEEVGASRKARKQSATQSEVKDEVKDEVKEESKQQPTPAHGIPGSIAQASEERMCKAELVEYHQLKVLDKGAESKKQGMWCQFCNKAFEARNRAKVWQHCSGLEHRRLWRAGIKKEDAEAVVDGEAKIKDEGGALRPDVELSEGKCKGLRLRSKLGLKTRLGNDLFPVFKQYCKFATLERTGGGSSMSIQIEACQWSNMVDPRVGRSKSCAEVR